MHKLEARAVIVERLRNFDLMSPFLTAADVADLVGWIESQDFIETCRAADADPVAVQRQFNGIVNKAFDQSLRSLPKPVGMGH